jgi:hypothetical protein
VSWLLLVGGCVGGAGLSAEYLLYLQCLTLIYLCSVSWLLLAAGCVGGAGLPAEYSLYLQCLTLFYLCSVSWLLLVGGCVGGAGLLILCVLVLCNVLKRKQKKKHNFGIKKSWHSVSLQFVLNFQQLFYFIFLIR